MYPTTQNPKAMTLETLVSLPKGTKLRKVYSQYPNCSKSFTLSHIEDGRLFGTYENSGSIVNYETHLTDSGVVPYDGEGRWNPTNYLILDDSEEEKEEPTKEIKQQIHWNWFGKGNHGLLFFEDSEFLFSTPISKRNANLLIEKGCSSGH